MMNIGSRKTWNGKPIAAEAMSQLSLVITLYPNVQIGHGLILGTLGTWHYNSCEDMNLRERRKTAWIWSESLAITISKPIMENFPIGHTILQ